MSCIRAQRFLVPLVAALVLVAVACGELFDPAAAAVGNRKISADEIRVGLEDFMETQEYERLAAQGDRESIQREFEQAFLSQLIRKAVLEPEAEERGIEVTPSEVQEQLDEIKQDFASQSAFEEALREQGLTPEQLEGLVEQSILEDKLRARITEDAAQSEDELRAYYDEHVDRFTQRRVQHILVDQRALADEIAGRLQSIPENRVDDQFDRLAARFSTDSSNADDGGDLGFTSPGDLVRPFERAMDELSPGEVSDPVETEFGFHVIRVIDRRTRAFGEVRSEIEGQLGSENEDRIWSEWLRDAYERADIRVNSRYGVLDLESQQVVDPTAGDIPGADEGSPTPAATPS